MGSSPFPGLPWVLALSPVPFPPLQPHLQGGHVLWEGSHPAAGRSVPWQGAAGAGTALRWAELSWLPSASATAGDLKGSS